LIIVLWQGQPLPSNTWRFLIVTIPQQLAALSFSVARRYVNYSALRVFKAVKPVAVVCTQIPVLGWYPRPRRLIVVVLISVGFLIFEVGTPCEFTPFGAVIAFCGLVLDAFSAPIVDRMKRGRGGHFVLMLYANGWSVLLLSVLRFGELIKAANWIAEHHGIVPKLILFGITGAIGHVALFVAISMTDGLVVSIATCLRRFSTELIAACFQRRQLRCKEWIGLAMVAGALAIEGMRKRQNLANRADEDTGAPRPHVD
jgi:drug/metabolite transporter (DMT)-like permease